MEVSRLVEDGHDGEDAALRPTPDQVGGHRRWAGARRFIVRVLVWVVAPIVTWALVVGLVWLAWKIV